MEHTRLDVFVSPKSLMPKSAEIN